MSSPPRARFVRAVALAAIFAPPALRAQAVGGYGDYLAWENWARVVPGERGALVSSWDRSGGPIDANQYEDPPGVVTDDRPTVAVRMLHGPGIIYRFWMPHWTATRPFVVRMYFDGETSPRIDADSGQLLGGTFGYFGAPFLTTFAGGQVCYEPIAFRDSLRIETENRSHYWHFYQYSLRLFPQGTEVTSYTGKLTPETAAARGAVAAMFDNVGQHPAGESGTSIWERTGARVIPAGGQLTVADLVGPGLVRRLNVRMSAATDAALDSLELQVRYDGEADPSIDAPVGWFFGAGHGRVAYKSLPLGTDSPDGFYSYWPMPFRQGMRIELVNASGAPIPVDSVRLEHEAQPVANDAGYLHAAAKKFLHPYPTTRDVMATVTGTGNYVGNLLFAQHNHADFGFLEGDDLVVVDGADSLHGTGLEDAYNGGVFYNWIPSGLPEPEGDYPSSAIRPLCGILRVEYSPSPDFARADQYRWRIADRVPFTQSLEVSQEMWGTPYGSQWISVVFWYQLLEGVSGGPGLGQVVPHSGGLELSPCEPTPTAAASTIRFVLPRAAAVTLDLLDVHGRKVRAIVEGRRAAGAHELTWSRGGLADGVYFLRLAAGGEVVTRKVVLVK